MPATSTTQKPEQPVPARMANSKSEQILNLLSDNLRGDCTIVNGKCTGMLLNVLSELVAENKDLRERLENVEKQLEAQGNLVFPIREVTDGPGSLES